MHIPALIRICLGLSMGPAVAYGLSRFAYGLLLSPMQQDLGLSYGEAGAITTANNLGYLLGAILAMCFVRVERSKQAFVWGMFLTAVFVAATALVRDFGLICLLRAASGLMAAFALVSGGVIASHAGGDDRRRSATAISIYYCGGGIGIAASSVLTLGPFLDDPSSWPLGWYVLGFLILVASFLASMAAGKVSVTRMDIDDADEPVRWLDPHLFKVAVVYFFFGVGHIGYITFIVAFLEEQELSMAGIGLFWLQVGVLATCGAFLWSPVISRIRTDRALAVILVVIATGAVLPLVGDYFELVSLSALLFGSSFLSVVGAVNYIVRESVSKVHWPAAIGFMTVSVGIGQSIGPVLIGYVTEIVGGLGVSLMFPPLVLLGGCVLMVLPVGRVDASLQAVGPGEASGQPER